MRISTKLRLLIFQFFLLCGSLFPTVSTQAAEEHSKIGEPILSATLYPGVNYFCDMAPVSINLFEYLKKADTQWLNEYCRIPVEVKSGKYVFETSSRNPRYETKEKAAQIHFEIPLKNLYQIPWGIQVQIVKQSNNTLTVEKIHYVNHLEQNPVRQQLVDIAKALPGSFGVRRNVLQVNLTELRDFDTKLFEEFSKNIRSPEELQIARSTERLGERGVQRITEAEYTSQQLGQDALKQLEVIPYGAKTTAMKFYDPWFDALIPPATTLLTAEQTTPIGAAWLKHISDNDELFIVYDNLSAASCKKQSCSYFHGWGKPSAIMAVLLKSGKFWQRTPENSIPETFQNAVTEFSQLPKMPASESLILKIPFSKFYQTSLSKIPKTESMLYNRRVFDPAQKFNVRRATFGGALLDVELLQAFSFGCTKTVCSFEAGKNVFNSKISSGFAASEFLKASIPWLSGTDSLQISLPTEILNGAYNSCSSSAIYLSALLTYEMTFSNTPKTPLFSCGYAEKPVEEITVNHLWCWYDDGQMILENGKLNPAEFGVYRSDVKDYRFLAANEITLTEIYSCQRSHETHQVRCTAKEHQVQLPEVSYTGKQPGYRFPFYLYYNIRRMD